MKFKREGRYLAKPKYGHSKTFLFRFLGYEPISDAGFSSTALKICFKNSTDIHFIWENDVNFYDLTGNLVVEHIFP